MKRFLFIFIGFLVISRLLLSFAGEPVLGDHALVILPDGREISAQVVQSEEERKRGLMFRENLDENEGMLFVFAEEDFHSFWMKNMVIPLDFIWLDREKRIVHIEKNVPPCKQEPCPTYTSKVPAMFFLELKAGSVEKRKLKKLDRLDFILPII